MDSGSANDFKKETSVVRVSIKRMNLEFHYYWINFLARRSGWTATEAELLAYSSQFVDHNIISYRIDLGRSEYRIEPTQNYGFWSDYFPNEVYLPFHFFPGDSKVAAALRLDGATNRFVTTPNSPGVKALLIDGLKSRDIYRVGIALHTYADSWAHQNFSGIMEPWNRVDTGSPIPPIGHAQLIRKPDLFDQAWTDARLRPPHDPVSNRDRFIEAAMRIYKYLSTYSGKGFDDVEMVEWELTELLGTPAGRKGMEERISDFIIADSVTEYDRRRWLDEALVFPPRIFDEELFRGYSKLLWLKDELLHRTSVIERKPVRPKSAFEESHLFRWHEAAKDHRSAAKRILGDLVGARPPK